MAGIDGIKNKLEPPDPIDKDLYDLPPEEHAALKQVPGSLLEVLGELESDHQWRLEGGVFTQDVIDTWIGTSASRNTTRWPCAPTPTSSACTTTCRSKTRDHSWGDLVVRPCS